MQAEIVDRKIILQKDFIYQGDNNAVKIEFICNKQFQEHDLSNFNAFVKITLTDGVTAKILLTQKQADSQSVIFEWLIDGSITAAIGTLRYQVVFEAIDSQTVINTEIAEVEVRESLYSLEDNIDSYEPSLIITMQQLISQNSLFITEQKNRIDDLDNVADSLQTGLSQAQSAITTNSGSISSLQTSLGQAQSAITTNSGNISVLQTDLGQAQSAISANSGSISSLQTSLGQAQSAISANSGNISSLQTGLGQAQSAITVNSGSISSLQTDLGQAQSDIVENSGSISSLQTNLNQVESNINAALDNLDDSRLYLQGEEQDGYQLFIDGSEAGLLDSIKIFGTTVENASFENPTPIKYVEPQINFKIHGKNFIENAVFSTTHGEILDTVVYEGLCKAPCCLSYAITVSSSNATYANQSLFIVKFADNTIQSIIGRIQNGIVYVNLTKDVIEIRLVAEQRIESQISNLMLLAGKYNSIPTYEAFTSQKFIFNVKDTLGNLHTLSNITDLNGARLSDEISKADDGTYRIIKKIYRVNLRGCTWINVPSGNYYYTNVSKRFIRSGLNSNIFKHNNIHDGEQYLFGADFAGNNALRVRVPLNLFPNMQSWQEYTNNNDVIIEYELKDYEIYQLDEIEAQKLDNIHVYNGLTAFSTQTENGILPLLDITEIRNKERMHYVILTDKTGNKKVPFTVAEQVYYSLDNGTRQNLQEYVRVLESRIEALEK